MKKTNCRWGILSTGVIAHQFAEGLRCVPGARLVAVGSRHKDKAEAFGRQFKVPHRHASYEALASDPEVDVVYIGTPHTFHKENALLCLEAGKAVLLEKPFTINAEEARQVIELARKKRFFLMEAMWTRFVPPIVRLRQMLAEKVIGEVLAIQADFGFRAPYDPQSRLFNPELGGGALLDVGVYPVSLVSMVFGTPVRIESTAHRGKTGVDEIGAAILSYQDERLALIATSLRVNTSQEVVLTGTKGRIHLHRYWWRGSDLTLSLDGKKDKLIKVPMQGNGYNYEAAEVTRLLSQGKKESKIMPLDETLSIMETMDSMREQWGLKYPMELRRLQVRR